jgi:large subunit ribosomal protein L4e
MFLRSREIKMKATLKTSAGESKGMISLPHQFDEPVREDLIKRAVLAIQSHKRQPHGTDPEAGKKYSSKISRRRRDYKTAYGMGVSRVPRKIMNYRGTRFNWVAATVPYAVGGREAHPPLVEKKWEKKINSKERRKAIRSALAASVRKDMVEKRGHIVAEYPLVLEDSVEDFKKSKEILDLLLKLGLEKEIERSSKRSQKSGRAKSRGRTVKQRKGPLIVVSKKCSLENAAANLPGVDVVRVDSLNAEVLAPGCDFGRLTLYTKGAIDMLEKQNLFTDYSVVLGAKEEKPAPKKIKPSAEKTETAEKPKATRKKAVAEE